METGKVKETPFFVILILSDSSKTDVEFTQEINGAIVEYSRSELLKKSLIDIIGIVNIGKLRYILKPV